MKLIRIFFLCLLTTNALIAQTISGFIEDASSGERLIGAAIKFNNQGVISNRYGYFSIKVNVEPVRLMVSYLGFETKEIEYTITKDTSVLIKLHPVQNNLNEVVITSSPKQELSSIDHYTIPLELVKKAPAFLGESDLFKTIQYLPGVQAGNEGTAGINVRGGTPDQNLILLDGVPVYNINHMFGFFSVINPDAVSHVDFMKGSFPAKYGGRLSSIMDIAMKEGNLQSWHGTLSLNPIATRLMVEGPLKKDVSSILVSGRSTWINGLIGLGTLISNSENSTNYGFYDLNVKLNYKLSPKDQLYGSFYTGHDGFRNQFKFDNSVYRFGLSWGNATAALRWNRVWHKHLFSNTTAYYTQYNYNLSQELTSEKRYNATTNSSIKDKGVKIDFDQILSNQNTLKYGAGLVHHTFAPENKSYQNSRMDSTAMNTPVESLEWSTYLEDEYSITNKLKLVAGVHYMGQHVQKSYFHSFQPRISLHANLTSRSKAQFSYNRTAQFLHLLTNSSLGLPTDLWVPAIPNVGPEKAEQWALGYAFQLNDSYSLTSEVYYKNMEGVVEYTDLSAFLSATNIPWYDRVTVGKSRSKGLEVYLNKSRGKTKGWISYTLSKTDRKFASLNEGNWFPFKYDRRNNLAMVITHDFSSSKTLSFNFVYNTGVALTLPTSFYEGALPSNYVHDLNNPLLINYKFYQSLGDMSQRNNFRAPAYHRMDVSYKLTKLKVNGTRSWIFNVYNLYNRQNPYFIYYDQQKLKQFSLLPILPSVTYQREF
ncbi:TonB-dependent receptor [Siphonobacter sp. BAB-5385]|uniref:TonB-dependent receptor n=1 Tax=Siphonobacter sp. BAB-5385 TaxID=1864822 RepID=UPI0015951F72|nr:TonB-dependent receptor [Siphonobacter sp. BAB-5385]